MLSAMIIGICSQAGAAAYSGKVFVDANHNGCFDKGEKVLQKVSVSDGLNVVQTDASGSFTLPGHDKARSVYITVPDGYRAPAYYQRISATTLSYDFALEVQPAGLIDKDGTHRFIHISDTHIDPSMRSATDGHALASKALRAKISKATANISTPPICPLLRCSSALAITTWAVAAMAKRGLRSFSVPPTIRSTWAMCTT